MIFVSDNPHENGRKITFSDIDDWGYTRKGIIFFTNEGFVITGIELYSSKHGVVRCIQNGEVTYCHGWEGDHVKQGIGVSDHFAAKLINNEKESLEIYDKILDHLLQTLKSPYLGQILSHFLKSKVQVSLDLSSFKSNKYVETGNGTEKVPTNKSIMQKIFKK